MPDSSGIQALVDAAEKAASVGDWPSAEERLRRAAADQEAQLGPGHIDLAYTLNNLGVVCERTGKPDEAEQFYGRANAIAAAALPLDDPLVVTSGQNLRELSASRGKPLITTPSAAPPGPPIEARTTPAIEPRAEGDPPSSATVDVTSRSHASTTGIAAVVGLAIAAFFGWYFWSGSGESVESVESHEVVEIEAQSVPAPAAAPAPESLKITESDRAVRLPPPAASEPVSVVEAELCSALSTKDWRCAPASPPTAPGLLYFYTRLRSPMPTKIEHRWYYEDRLVQTLTLEIGANQGAGYRTNSRQTINPERAGNWRVELRSQDGTVLHEERFVVGQ
jgi:Protein of unknown function (DUF2914)/Tetratricopeptide repeat